jgi:phospholipid transport system substrate-binding protein
MAITVTDSHATRLGAARVTSARVLGTGILALTLVVGARAEAGPPTDTLREVFTDVNKALVGPIRRSELAGRVLNVRVLLNRVLDFRNAATRALGDEWSARAPAEQEEFVKLFADLLERSCVAQVASMADRSEGIRIDYLDETVDGEAGMVWTTILTKGGGEVPFDFVMVRHEGHWMIRDVLVEGVSLVANIRSQFKRIIRDSSYAGLVARMKERTLEEPPARPLTTIDAIPSWGTEPRTPIRDGQSSP